MARRKERPVGERMAEDEERRKRIDQMSDWLASKDGFFDDLIEFMESKVNSKAGKLTGNDWRLAGDSDPLAMLRDVAHARGFAEAIAELKWLDWYARRRREDAKKRAPG